MTNLPTHCVKCGDELRREPINNASHPDYGRDVLVCPDHGANGAGGIGWTTVAR